MSDPQTSSGQGSSSDWEDLTSSGQGASSIAHSASSELLDASGVIPPWIPGDERGPNNVGRSIRLQIENALSGVQQAGSYAAFGALEERVDPQLHVDGLGLIELPLSEKGAKSIITKCRQSPFGKGTETVVDETVRKTWQLDASQFKTENPQWEATLTKIVTKIGIELGVTAVDVEKNVKAEPYKVLLYEEGAFFKPHADSEKTKGMFGTLIVCLPSLHEGGAVIVKHAGSTKTFETSKNSESGYSAGAWYSDVMHEIKPVTSGYRLVLTYNLVQENPSMSLSAATMDESMIQMRNALDLWNSKLKLEDVDGVVPDKLAYFLSHKYTERGLSLGRLKSKDQLQVRCLKESCAEKGFLVLLANLEREIMGGIGDGFGDEFSGPEEAYMPRQGKVGPGGTFHAIDDICDDDLTLKHIVELDGRLVGKNIKIELGDIVQDDPFGMPDEEDFSGFTGNEGVSNTLFYRSTVAVIVPRQYKMSLLYDGFVQGKLDTEDWMCRLTRSDDPDDKEDLLTLCSIIVTNNSTIVKRSLMKKLDIPSWGTDPLTQKKPFSDTAIAMVISAAIGESDFVLFKNAVDGINSALPELGWSNIGLGIRTHGLDAYQESMDIAVGKIPHMHLLFSALDDILGYIIDGEYSGLPILDAETIQRLHAWRADKVSDALASTAPLIKLDGPALVQKILIHDTPFLFEKIVPLVKRNLSNTPFFLSFLSALCAAPSIPPATVRAVFRDVASALLSIDLGLLPLPKATRSIYFHAVSPPRPLKSGALTGEDLGTLLAQCHRLFEDPADLDALMQRVLRDAEACHTDMFVVFFLPCVRALVASLAAAGVSAGTHPHAGFARRLIQLYIERYVGMAPVKPLDWTRKKLGCGQPYCECAQLDEFLEDPAREIMRFQGERGLRDHIEFTVGDACTTHEERVRKDPAPPARRGVRKTRDVLVVKKNTKEFEYEMREWRKRCETAVKQIGEVGEGKAEEVFEESGKAGWQEFAQIMEGLRMGTEKVGPQRRF